MHKDARERLAESVLARSSADEAEVAVYSQTSALTRFTHNAIHQNVASSDTLVAVRAVAGKRTGVARSNDPAAFEGLAGRAKSLAEFAPSDPDFPGLPTSENSAAPEKAFVEATARAGPDVRARWSDAIFRVAENSQLWAAGFATTSSSGFTLLNSRGHRSSFDGTDGGINVKMNASDSSGFAEHHSGDIETFDARGIAERAAQKARDCSSPQPVEPGEWTVILEPAAFGELVAFLSEHFSAEAFHEGSSFLSDGLERSYTGENVFLNDDYAHVLRPSMPFDYEGMRTRRLPLLAGGVAKNIVTDSYWAAKLGRENTGHALPAPNSYGPQPTHLVVEPGEKPLEQLIAETERGLLVTRFWYVRTVDQRKTIVTGMTRDGTFLIEGGKVGHGVRNLRFNQSILEALRECEFADMPVRTASYAYSLVVPAVKIRAFAFSSGTAF